MLTKQKNRAIIEFVTILGSFFSEVSAVAFRFKFPFSQQEHTKSDDSSRPEPQQEADPSDQKIISIYQNAPVKLAIQAPVYEQQAAEIADLIRRGYILVLNLERCDYHTACRLLDFVSGASYAKEFEITKVAVSTYLITPPNVAVSDYMAKAI